jgi:hypothetical protein
MHERIYPGDEAVLDQLDALLVAGSARHVTHLTAVSGSSHRLKGEVDANPDAWI